jgi:pimeloyl-ACP methyl ester carboxylesterase
MFLAGFDDHRRTVSTQPGEVSYIEVGTGPAALFVHGIATSAYIWHNLIPLLAGTRRCVAIDLPLHGQSPATPEHQLTVGAFADTLAEVCARLSLGQVDLVGHDTGGAIAQVFAARHPELVRTLTLTNCETHDNIPPAAMAATVEAARAGQLAATARQSSPTPPPLGRSSPSATRTRSS